MTFKNVDFQSSEVMRSLEKLAVKKGLVQPETMKKEASAVKPSLQPTGDLTQDLLKLCEGLRRAGFSKYADDVESKFVQLKKAESLYETSKETGEALLDDAHPEGSVKLKDMDGDATVETVADIKKKIEDLVKKTPKGKLANQDFINIIKITLGQTNELDALYAQANENFEKFKQVYIQVLNKLGEDVNFLETPLRVTKKLVDSKQVYQHEGLEDHLNSYLNQLKEEFGPGWLSGNDTKRLWRDEISPIIGHALKYSNTFSSIIGKIRKLETDARVATTKQYDPDAVQNTMTQPPSKDQNLVSFENYLSKEISLINTWKSALAVKRDLNAKDKSDATAWLNQQLADLENINKSLNTFSSNEEKLNFASKTLKDLTAIIKENREFEAEWL